MNNRIKLVKREYLEERLYSAEKLIYDIFTNPKVMFLFEKDELKRMGNILSVAEDVMEWQKEAQQTKNGDEMKYKITEFELPEIEEK